MNDLFHYENIIFIIVLLFPNFILLIFKPIHLPNASKKTIGWKVVEWIGHIGRLLIIFFCLRSPVSLDGTLNYVILVLMALVLGLYYMGWIRYITSDHDYRVLFEPLLNIPLPTAIFPILFLLLVSWLIESSEMGISTLIFAIAHILDSDRLYHEYLRKKDV